MYTGWLKKGGHTYYLLPGKGYMLTSWQKIGNNYFRIDECIDKTTGQDNEFDARFNYLLSSLEAR